jgi:hypothetical protein
MTNYVSVGQRRGNLNYMPPSEYEGETGVLNCSAASADRTSD